MSMYQTNPTRAEVIWLDVTKRNPKLDGETFAEWLTRLGGIMAKSQREEPTEVNEAMRSTRGQG